MKMCNLFLSMLFLHCFSLLYVYTQEFGQEGLDIGTEERPFWEKDGIVDSMELCPFTIEIYPETLHVGDILHVKMSFENKSGMVTWALPNAITEIEVMETHDIMFYFQDDETGIQYPWHFQGGYGHYWPRPRVWQPIMPGEKAKTQFWSLGFSPVLSRVIDDPTDYDTVHADIYRFSNSATSLLWTPGLTARFLGNMQKNGAKGHLMVTLRTLQGGTAEAPINKTITVTCPQKITVLPRKKAEVEMIHKFYSNNNMHVSELNAEYYEMAHNEFPKVIEQTTPGTLRNLLQMHLHYLELYASYRKHSKKPVEELLRKSRLGSIVSRKWKAII